MFLKIFFFIIFNYGKITSHVEWLGRRKLFISSLQIICLRAAQRIDQETSEI